MHNLLSRVAQYGVLYIVLQIIVGIEVGILAAAVATLGEMTIPAALAATVIPVGMPLRWAHAVLLVAWYEGLLTPHSASPQVQ